MVCPIGTGKMAVMARLLEAESFSQTMAEEISHQKLAAQYFYRELREADEANLLDEEDMHVFGLKPMTDTLHLVCCNACKKPVKASQYVAHAELCRSLRSIGDTILEAESGMSNKKPPRKERKKLLTAHAQATSVEHNIQELVNANETAGLEPKSENQIGIKSSSAVEGKDSASVTCVADGIGMSPGNTDYSDSMMPPAKRSKLIAGKHLPLSNDSESSGVTKTMRNQDTYPCRGFIDSGSQRPMNKCGRCYREHGEVHICCISLKDVPVPLATKTYYSQRSNRLRSALTHLYCTASAKDLYTDATSKKISQERNTSFQNLNRKDSSVEGTDDLYRKTNETPFEEPEFVVAQHSEVCSSKLGRRPDQNQVPVDGVPRPEIAAVGFIGSKYLLNPYPFSVNSGKTLGVQQQPNGGVPVT